MPYSGVSLGTPVLCKSSICLYIQTIPGFELSFQSELIHKDLGRKVLTFRGYGGVP